jgi:hypothetical protein
MSETTATDKDLSKFKRYLHTGFETLEKLKTGDDLKDLKCLVNLVKINHGLNAVEIIKSISVEGKLKDRTFLITALAVCARQTFDIKTKTRAYEILRNVCVNPHDLFLFLAKCELFGFLLLNAGELQEIKVESLPKKASNKTVNKIPENDLKTQPTRITSAIKKEQAKETPATSGQNVTIHPEIKDNAQTLRISSAKNENQHKRVSSANKKESNASVQQNEQIIRILSGKKENSFHGGDQAQRISSAHKNDKPANELLNLPSINVQSTVQEKNQNKSISKKESEIKLPNIVSDKKNKESPSRSGFMSPTNNQTISLPNSCLNTGWGRAHKKAINKWYNDLKPLEFALFLINYPRKYKWRHRDVFRLSHFKSTNVISNFLVIYANRGIQASTIFYESLKDKEQHEFSFTNKKNNNTTKVIYNINAETRQELTFIYEYLKGYESIKLIKDENAIMKCIQKHDFDIQHVFSRNKIISKSNEIVKKIWTLYLKKQMIPLSKILKSLSNLGKRGLIQGELEDLLCQRINDRNLLEKEKLHPLYLFTVHKIYSRGGNSLRKYQVNSNLAKSLYEMFLSSFKYIEVIDKPFAICLNTWILSKASLFKNTLVTPFQASIIMLLCSLNSQPNSKLYALSDKMEELNINKEMEFSLVVSSLWQSTIGTTNFSLPIISSSDKNLKFDCFVVYTNLEPGLEQPQITFKALEKYRSALANPKARFLYVSMVASHGQIAEPSDENMLDLIGFTHNSPQIILNFLKGLF